MFKFKNKGSKTEVFKGNQFIGTLERTKDLVNEKYFAKYRYIYIVTKPDESKEIFNSRQKAAKLLLQTGES